MALMYDTLITVNELLPNYTHENWVIVDCRFQLGDVRAGRKAYEVAHIPGAVYAHLDEDLSGIILPGITGRHPLPDVESLAALFSSWGITEGVQVVAYDDKSGAIAARLWWLLKWLGHEAVAVLDSGWSGWLKGGGAQAGGVEYKTAATFVARPDHSRIKSLAAVEATDRNFTLVDSRTAERYRGEQEPIDPIAGHIPGAINFPHPNNVSSDEDTKTRSFTKVKR
jgi:thiosulfate/3-mercaptopyruvate sulfurtransferase